MGEISNMGGEKLAGIRENFPGGICFLAGKGNSPLPFKVEVFDSGNPGKDPLVSFVLPTGDFDVAKFSIRQIGEGVDLYIATTLLPFFN